MKFLIIVAALAHAAHSGNVGLRASNLIAPAGVTYVDGAYHAGLAAGPLAYSASLAQPVLQSGPAVAVAAAPVAYAAPAAKYAAVPTVQHVPGVADVPVTRIDAQPTVIQKTVDIARPAVKTQRYEVRRPAIQKQFYDIEERVVVRPAGSAVVELEEPLSRTQKGPSVIRPTGEGVAVSSSAVAVPAGPAVAALPAVSAVSPAPAELPSVEINLARSSLPAPAVGIARSSIAVAGPPAVPSVGIARSSLAVPEPVGIQSVGLARSSVAVAPPSVEIARSSFHVPSAVPSVGISRSAVAAPVPSVEVRASIPTASPAPLPSVGLARASFAAPAPAPLPSVQARTSFSAPVQTVSYSAPAPVQSVSYSAPATVQSVSYSAPAPVQSVSYSAPFGAHSVGISAVPVKTVSVSAPIQTTITGVSSVSSGASGISSVSAGPTEVSFSTPAPQYEQQIVQSTPAPQESDDAVSIESADFSFARSSGLSRSYSGPQTFTPAPAPVREPEQIYRAELTPRRYNGHPASSSRGSLIVNYPNPVDLIPQSRFRSASVYSEGNLQSEINHDNQQKLIQLLTARGGVNEVGLGRSGPASYPVEAGQVRARVLSATPAPAYAAPTGERVNTRRVVVSRPIETLQEVEVAEPVTKFERVQVDQPAVVKTASQDVVRVPTSVPVYGKALAPIAEAPVAAFSHDWH